jgi:hypothetical protein
MQTTTQMQWKKLEQLGSISLGGARTILLFAGLIALAGLIYLGQSSQATMTGQRVLTLQETMDRLNRENAQLEYEIGVLTAPAKIADRARALGLHPAATSQMTFIVVKSYPTSSVKPLLAQVPVSNLPPSGFVALWNELLARLGLAPSSRIAEATSSP